VDASLKKKKKKKKNGVKTQGTFGTLWWDFCIRTERVLKVFGEVDADDGKGSHTDGVERLRREAG
jgi:hypothetical protein